MNLILFDDENRVNLFPFTHTRPVANIRCGILTMRSRWEKLLGLAHSATLTTAALQSKYPIQTAADNLFINGAIVADAALLNAILKLKQDESLKDEKDSLIAFRLGKSFGNWENIRENILAKPATVYQESFLKINFVWDIFSKNAALIERDFRLLTAGKTSEKIPDYVTAISPENIFIAPGAKLSPCIINATQGPVYIGEAAEIMEGALIRGAFCLGNHATLKMGAKIYEGTTIGPHCKVGGEVNNAVFFNYSNKGHDGFIGNAVIGDWCNLGADTNCSNLKNNYDEVKIWNEHLGKMVSTGLQFCGLIMGDHSKCGINTMFNTGTVVGVSCNIFGAGFPDKFVPSFTWGGAGNSSRYQLDKAMDTANRMMARRHLALTEEDKKLWTSLFQESASGI